MTELSLTAQTVWHAFRDATNCAENKLAAALHAAADQLGENRAPGAEFEGLYPRIIEVDDLLAIADELEAQ